MIVIGLTGKAGSGKGVVADCLVREHGFTKLSFAAPLKKMLRTLDPYLGSNGRSGEEAVRLSDALHEVYDDELALKASDYGAEYRRLLQVLGTDCIRAVDEDFWVRAAMAQLTDRAGRYVFDDCRFPNEAEAIRYDACGQLIHIQRPGLEAVRAHASEEHAGNMDEYLRIVNNGTIAALEAEVDSLLGEYIF